MSLGLKDLKKTKLSKTKERASTNQTKPVTEKIAMRESAKPWSQRGLAKVGKSRTAHLGADHFVNDEWISLHETSIGAVDVSNLNASGILINTVVEIEDRLIEAVSKPFEALRRSPPLSLLFKKLSR